MAWVTRGGSRYFYRSRRRGDTFVREYLGSGPEAEKAADEIEARRARRKTLNDDLAELDETVECDVELIEAIDLLVREALQHAGYYEHSRTWRRRCARVKEEKG